jgi:hypothetical protein
LDISTIAKPGGLAGLTQCKVLEEMTVAGTDTPPTRQMALATGCVLALSICINGTHTTTQAGRVRNTITGNIPSRHDENKHRAHAPEVIAMNGHQHATLDRSTGRLDCHYDWDFVEEVRCSK